MQLAPFVLGRIVAETAEALLRQVGRGLLTRVQPAVAASAGTQLRALSA